MEVTYIQKKLIEHFRSLGYFAQKVQFKGIAGCPDLLIAKDGRHSTWIEVKCNKQEITPIQRKKMIQMIEAGFDCICLAVYTENTIFKNMYFVIFDPLDGSTISQGTLNDLQGMIYGPNAD
jgi:hypothetical protein